MKIIRLLAAASAAFFIAGTALAQQGGTVTQYAFAIGKGAGSTSFTSLLCGATQLAVGQSAANPICRTLTGDVTLDTAGVTAIGATKVTSAMLNSNVYSTAHSWSGQQTFVAPILGTPASGTMTNVTGLPISTGVAGLGTGIATALAVNVGTAGSPVVNGGVLGTPSSGTATNLTGLPVATGISGLGTNIAAFLATPSSANLRAALTDEVGTGAAYFVGGGLGTPASGTATNLTGLPLSGLTAQGAYTIVANNSGVSAVPTAVDVTALTSKPSPVSGDIVLIQDSAASNAFKRTTVGALASAGSVASFNGRTGAVTPASADYTAAQIGATGVFYKIGVQTFSASGTYTPSAGLVYAIIKCVGGGGGGGGASSGAGNNGDGGGGGAGSYSESSASAANIGASQTVTIGAAGTAGTSAPGSGGAGGATSVGTICQTGGGSGGALSTGGNVVTGGAGGVASTGNIVSAPGQAGLKGDGNGTTTWSSSGGQGGSGPFGSGGSPGLGQAAGNAGTGKGTGGGGGASYANTANVAGGAGTAGYVVITEFLNQ